MHPVRGGPGDGWQCMCTVLALEPAQGPTYASLLGRKVHAWEAHELERCLAFGRGARVCMCTAWVLAPCPTVHWRSGGLWGGGGGVWWPACVLSIACRGALELGVRSSAHAPAFMERSCVYLAVTCGLRLVLIEGGRFAPVGWS